MSLESKALNEIVRAMNNLAKSVDALNNTLATIERNRLTENNTEVVTKVFEGNDPEPQDHSQDSLLAPVLDCWRTTCSPFKGHVEGCPAGSGS